MVCWKGLVLFFYHTYHIINIAHNPLTTIILIHTPSFFSPPPQALQTNQAVGTEELIGLLKNYSRLGDTKSVIVVGVVGFPNVGKSSLINSLMRSRAVGVSSMPGKINRSIFKGILLYTVVNILFHVE